MCVKLDNYQESLHDARSTDTIIRNDSCHPQEHKLAAIRYLTNRMETYNLIVNNKAKEANTIKQILYNNKYDPSFLSNLTPLTNNTKTKKILKY